MQRNPGLLCSRLELLVDWGWGGINYLEFKQNFGGGGIINYEEFKLLESEGKSITWPEASVLIVAAQTTAKARGGSKADYSSL